MILAALLLPVAVVAIVLAIQRLRLPAFLAVMIVVVAYGWAANMTWQSIGKAFGLGFVTALEQTGLLVVAGSLAGTLLLKRPIGAAGAGDPHRPGAGRALAARGGGDVRPEGRPRHDALDRRPDCYNRPDRPLVSQQQRQSIEDVVCLALARDPGAARPADRAVGRADADGAARQRRCARILYRHQQAVDPGGAHDCAGDAAVATLAARGAVRHALGAVAADGGRGRRLRARARRDRHGRASGRARA